LIAEHLGLSRLECEEIEYAAPLHDIGKIGVSDNILLKPGKLTAAEWEVMKTHTTMGHAILKDSDSRFIKMGAVIALNHHEKFDGSGYPSGLAGKVIPLEARIVAVADVYDALRAFRPYKQGWSREDAVAYLSTQAGNHFDPSCTDAFLAQQKKIFEFEEQLGSDGL
jgi:two-component system response regulator RpfG